MTSSSPPEKEWGSEVWPPGGTVNPWAAKFTAGESNKCVSDVSDCDSLVRSTQKYVDKVA